jgi:tRNA(fMet)-specific endonuclease VapC
MKVLIDTSILIDFLRAKNKEKTYYYQSVKHGVKPVISLITYAELYAGRSVWEKKQAKKELEILLSGIKIAFPTENTAKEAGRIRAKTSILLYDAIIASTALSLKIPLFTFNKKDFLPIKGLSFYEKI